MQLDIKNIGPISHASIELNDITIIAGENDTGKSTIGKLIYSIIKSGINYEEDYNEFVVKKLTGLVKRAYRQLRKSVDFDADNSLRNSLSPILFERRLKSSIHSAEEILNITHMYTREYESVMEYGANFINKNNKMYIYELMEMTESIKYQLSREELMKTSLMRLLSSEFNNDITTRPMRGKSEVIIREGKNVILDFLMNRNTIDEMKFYDELIYPDVTYIETPMILNTGTRENSNIKNRNRDLISKLSDSSSKYDILYDKRISSTFRDYNKYRNEFFDFESPNISEIINGSLEYSIDDNEFYFRKSGKTKYSIENVASGVKAFGILDLLIKNNSLEPDSLIIIDEPEVHLHPKWQIEYGRIICELSRGGLKFLISTHSPYIIESISHFSRRLELNNRVNYYATQRVDNISTKIVNCNDNLDYIFSILSEPIEKLIWGNYNVNRI